MLALLGALFLCLLPAVCLGHILPRHSDPKPNSSITAPDSVRIWFDGDLEPAFSKITIRGAGGQRVDKGDSQVDTADPKLLRVGTRPLKPGTYRVLWEAVSRDGHHTAGEYAFTVIR